MNWFSGIQNAVNKINQYGNITHQKNFLPVKSDALSTLLQTCTYNDEIKFIVQKSVRQVLQTYTFYSIDKLQYMQGGYQRRFVQIIGQLIVENKGKIRFHIMYPMNFPKGPPFMRIINLKPTEMVPTNIYKQFQSSSDTKSFVLNQILTTCKKWTANTSVISLIIQLNNIVRNNFPFQTIVINKPTNNGSWGNTLFGIGSNQNAQYQQQVSNQSFNTSKNIQKPQLIIARSQALVGIQKKKLQELKAHHDPTLITVQYLSILNYSLDCEQNFIRCENDKMLNFVNYQSNAELGILDIVAPSNALSDQILSLTCSVKAREETSNFLQYKFNQEEITLQEFLKNVRKNEENKFQQKAILIKCLQSISRIKS